MIHPEVLEHIVSGKGLCLRRREHVGNLLVGCEPGVWFFKTPAGGYAKYILRRSHWSSRGFPKTNAVQLAPNAVPKRHRRCTGERVAAGNHFFSQRTRGWHRRKSTGGTNDPASRDEYEKVRTLVIPKPHVYFTTAELARFLRGQDC